MDDGETASEWMRHAQEDLDAARLLEGGGLHALAAFHAQQAAEKAMKAVLILRGRGLARTHDVQRLAADAKAPTNIAEIVSAAERLRARLRDDLPIDRIVLFGSRARGEARADSDIDLIVVSARFRGMSAGQRMYRVRKAWDLPVAVDFLCYAPEEFEALAHRASIVKIALAEGHDIASA
ncbi:MAG: uncharacterized protein QOE90_17 [Thermoplasmata archaeon]|nr:uncharacterized protein [Thermoplasmata archaeon]